MTRRDPLQRFWQDIERPPSRSRRVFSVLLGVALTWAVWDRRGAVAGLVAFAVYGVGFSLVALQHARVVHWSRRHPLLDTLLVIPLGFLALAYLTQRGLVWCAVASVALWATLLPLMLAIRRRREKHSAAESA